MRGAFIRFVLNVAGLVLAIRLVPGINFQGEWWQLLIIALIFGIVNALIQPLLTGLTCLINLLTLGLFTFVINALMLLLTAWIASQLNLAFSIEGRSDLDRFISALLGAIVISVFSFVLSLFVHEKRTR